MPDLKTAVSRFGADAEAKPANSGATGEPEDELRAPLEGLDSGQDRGERG